MNTCKRIILILCAVVYSNNGLSQEEVQDIDEKVTAKDLSGYIDLAVPETPAFAALGVTPENVITPGNQHELAFAILDSVDQNGNPQSGIAIEASPYALSMGDQVTLNEYKNSYFTRLLYNTKLSFATSSGSSDEDKADRKALGLRFSLINNGDLRSSDKVAECFTKIPRLKDEDVLVVGTSIERDGNVTVYEEVETSDDVLEAAGKCSEEASKSLWNAFSWDVGASYYEADDKSIDEDGYALWTSISLPIGKDGQVIFHAKHFEDMLNPDVNDDEIMDIKDGDIYAARLKWGSNKINFMLEASYSDVDYPLIDLKDKYQDYLIGTEFRVFKGAWLQFALGKRNGSSILGNNENYLSGQIRWAISESSLLK